MIGQVAAAISLSDVPLFSATTANGGIYLEPGGGVNSTAVDVDAGGMNGMTNNVSVTSQANFLTIENIKATGNAAVDMNDGSLFEPSAHFTGLVNVNPPRTTVRPRDTMRVSPREPAGPRRASRLAI